MNRLTILTLILAGLCSYEALAHTSLSASTPADAAVTNLSPDEIVLEFNADVRLLTVTLEKSGAQAVELGPVPETTQQHFTVAVPTALAPGEYLVTWRAVGADTHVVSGEIHFVVAA